MVEILFTRAGRIVGRLIVQPWEVSERVATALRTGHGVIASYGEVTV